MYFDVIKPAKQTNATLTECLKVADEMKDYQKKHVARNLGALQNVSIPKNPRSLPGRQLTQGCSIYKYLLFCYLSRAG